MKSYPMIVRPALHALSLATITVGSHAAPFQNGSFETPTIPTGGQTLPSGSTSIDGWITGGPGTLSFVRGVTFGIDPADGLQQIAFNGGDTVTGVTLSQSFDTVAGQAYIVSFKVGRSGTGSGTMSLAANVTSTNGSTLGSLTGDAPGSPGYGPTQTFTFTATTPTSTLTFQDTSSATVGVDLLLDSVSVQASSPPSGPFTNGSFESPILAPGSSVNLSPGTGGLTGWTVGSTGLVSMANGPALGVSPVDGSQHIGFNGGNTPPGASISQTFLTAIGQTYAVSCNLGRIGTGDGTMSLLAVVISGGNELLGSLNATAPAAPGYGPPQSFTFTATTTNTTLILKDTSSATFSVDLLLDNVSVVPVSGPHCVQPPSGLVGWWKGDGSASDVLGSNNGSLVGDASFAPGVVGQAFSFDGYNDSVMIGNPAALQLQNFSIEAWIKRASNNQASLDTFGGGHIFGYGYGGYIFVLLDDGRLALG